MSDTMIPKRTTNRLSAIVNDPFVVDVTFLVGLVFVALFSFRAAFGGIGFFTAGIVGSICAATIAVVHVRKHWPIYITLPIAALTYLLVATIVAARDLATAGFLPSPDAISEVLSVSVHGWSRAVTTLPPLGNTGHLYGIVFSAAFIATGLGCAALTFRKVAIWAAAFPVLLLGVGVTIGTHSPALLLIVGGMFAALLMIWLSRLHAQRRVTIGTTRSARNGLWATAMMLLVAVLASAVGPSVPFASAKQRYVLRDRIVPPFDPRAYASPLVAYRKYSDKTSPTGGGVSSAVSPADREYFSVTPTSGTLPNIELRRLTSQSESFAGPFRIAELDSFDGLVWNVAGPGSVRGDVFEQVGDPIPNNAQGSNFEARIEIQRLDGVWLPTIGSTESIEFHGDRRSKLSTSFRFNRAIDTAAILGGITANDSYTVRSVITVRPSADGASLVDNSVTAAQIDASLTEAFGKKAAKLISETNSKVQCTGCLAQIQALEQALQTKGFFADETTEPPSNKRAPGHSSARLRHFIDAPNIAGNDEQYAAAMALMLRSMNIPARVGVGFLPKANRAGGRLQIKGADIAAWVEVPFKDHGWVAFFPTPPKDQDDFTDPAPPTPDDKDQTKVDPPPPPQQNTDDSDDVASKTQKADKDEKKKDDEEQSSTSQVLLIVGAVGGLLLVLASPGLTVLLLKVRRRKRRRTRGSASNQVHGAWLEVVDTMRDLGRPVAPKATRYETASLLDQDEVVELANAVDATIFGGAEPSPEVAATTWELALRVRSMLTARLSFADRFRAAVNVTSLRSDV